MHYCTPEGLGWGSDRHRHASGVSERIKEPRVHVAGTGSWEDRIGDWVKSGTHGHRWASWEAIDGRGHG